MKRLLEHDPETQRTSYLHTDPDGGAVIESVQDVDAILGFNAQIPEHFDKKADWWLIGQIPLDLCQQWAQESGTKVFTKSWQEYAKKQVQKAEYRKLNPAKIKL